MGFKLYSLLKLRVLLTETTDLMTKDYLLLAYKQSAGVYGPGLVQASGHGVPQLLLPTLNDGLSLRQILLCLLFQTRLGTVSGQGKPEAKF